MIVQKIGKLGKNGQVSTKIQSAILNQEEINNLTRPTTSSEIESIIEKLPENKSPVLIGFTGEFYETYEEKLIPILLKLYQIIENKGILQNTFYKATVT